MRTKTETNIQLGHGGGGLLTREFLDRHVVPRFATGPLEGLPDGATLPALENGIIFSTDSFVVHPMFFPGGNIGDLAVHGTVNDVAVSGGIPRWLSLGMILEEGIEQDVVGRVLDSVAEAAADCGVQVVTGDTKVVPRGLCDGMYLNTAGIGERMPEFDLGAARLQTGDVILASGTLGDHGMGVMAAREGIEMAGGPVSDTGPVHRLVQAARPFATEVRFMRDPTRGGVAAVLNELVEDAPLGIILQEDDLPWSTGARAIAETLGFDLLHSACEGRMLMACAPDVAGLILDAWRAIPEGNGATAVGAVTNDDAGRVLLETCMGGRRLVDVPQGELLPRIC